MAAAILLAYFAALGAWAFAGRRRSAPSAPPGADGRLAAFDEFAVAGRRQSAGAVAWSLVATGLGASTTLAVADLAARRGAVAFAWLGVGAAGLWVQARFFAATVRGSGARTLPELAGRFAGLAGRRAIAGVIAVAWIGVVAAQFAGLATILGVLWPDGAAGGTGAAVALWLAGGAVIAYTAVGGQRAVIRTDRWQAAWLFAALALTLAWLTGGGVPGAAPIAWTPLAPADWTAWDTARVAVLVGGAYVVGPDLFSRDAAARDGGAARRACAWAGAGLAVAGLGVTAVGLWARANGHVPGGATPFVVLLDETLPGWLAGVLAVGLAGALVSSADTCLVSVASMVEVDLLARPRVGRARGWVVAAGVAALAVATFRRDVMPLLLAAYSVYVPGVAGPVAVALLGRRRTVRRGRWLAAVAAGGALGLAGELAPRLRLLADPWARPGLALLGVAVGVGLAVLALGPRLAAADPAEGEGAPGAPAGGPASPPA